MGSANLDADTGRALSGGGLAVILFTDLVGSTALMTRLGDEAMHELQSTHIAEVRRAVEAYGGVVHKALGDGVMASFTSAVGALAAAATVARDAEALDRRMEAVGLAVRVGVSVGEPIAEDGDLQGLAVVIASRLCAAAGANEVLIQEAVRDLVEPRRGFRFESQATYELKGITARVSAAALDWRSHVSDAPISPDPGPPDVPGVLTITTDLGGDRSPVPPQPARGRRASDRDREATASRVRTAAATGQLTYSELEDRLALVFSGQTLGDLEHVVDDLGPAPVAVQTPDAGHEVSRTLSIFGSGSRRGIWSLGAQSRVTTVCGSTTIDLTQARLGHPVNDMRVLAFWGAATLRIPDGIEVHVTKTTLAGRTSVRLGHDGTPEGSPVLRLRLVTVMGSIKVRRWRPRRRR